MTNRHGRTLGDRIIGMNRFRVETSDPDVVIRTSYELFGNPLTFENTPARAFSSRIDGFQGDAGLSAARSSLPESTRLDSGDIPSYSVTLSLAGTNGWHVGDSTGSLDVPLLLPPGRSMVLTSLKGDVDVVTLAFAPGLIEKFLGHAPMQSIRLTDANTLRTEPTAMVKFLSYVGDLLNDSPDIVEHPLIEASLIDAVLSLAVVTYNLSEPGPALPTTLMSRPLTRATTFIAENLESPVTTADIADAARMSARGLQALFQREFGTTPMTYQRRLRLDAVREDLIAAEPESSDVASIARRWGFGHLSRFATTYRAQFGENPSDTLRR
jgi:AraC-like DNA-binding protein